MDATQVTILVILVGIIVFFIKSGQADAKKLEARRQHAAEVAAARATERADVLAAFAAGTPPKITVPNVVFIKDERPIWSEPAELYEERVTSRKWEGGSKGISVPIGILNTKIHLGKTKGQLNIERANVPVASGALVITSKHLLFKGDTKSTKTALNKIISLDCAANGITVAVTGRAKPWIIIFNDPEAGEVVREAINHAYAAPQA